MRAYLPQPGTVPAKVVDWLVEHPGEHSIAVICEDLDIATEGVPTSLVPAVRHGLLRGVKRNNVWYYAAAQEIDHMVQRTVPAESTVRWAVWSDGRVLIENQKHRIELDTFDAKKLVAFLQKALAV